MGEIQINRGKTCITPSCNNKARIKGLCSFCYNKKKIGEKRKRAVLDCLKERYEELGKNFYFKSKNLKIDLNSRIIGKIVFELVGEGFVKIPSPGRQRPYTYLTNFKKR